MATDIQPNVLVGLVELKPQPGNDHLGEMSGAYTNAVTRAVDELEFRARVTEVFDDLGFDVVHVRTLERARDRHARGTLSPTLLDAARRALSADGVFWDVFHTFPEEEEE